MKGDPERPVRAIYNLYQHRARPSAWVYALLLLAQGFDFKAAETYQYAREKEPWPQSDAEARDLWRKRVKNDWLRLKLSGKDDKAIASILDKRYDTSSSASAG